MRKIWLWITNAWDGFVAVSCGLAIIILAALAFRYGSVGPAIAIAVYGGTIYLYGRYIHRNLGKVPNDSSTTWVDYLISTLPGFAVAIALLWGVEIENLVGGTLFAVASIPFGALCARIVTVRRAIRNAKTAD